MKAVFAIFAALMFIGAQTLAFAEPVSVAAPCHCVKACCSASQSNPQSSVPAVPASTGVDYQLLTPAPAALVWALPAAPVAAHNFSEVLSTADAGMPLFARHCTRLI